MPSQLHVSRKGCCRFAVWALLLLLLVVGTLGCWLVWLRGRYEAQALAVREIERLGGFAACEPKGGILAPFIGPDIYFDVTFLNLNGRCPPPRSRHGADEAENYFNPESLPWLEKIIDVSTMCFDHSAIRDEDLKKLTHFKSLKDLTLSETHISDRGLESVGKLAALEVLDLSGTNISDDGLAHLVGLTRLKRIYLDNTRVTGVGFRYLTGLSQLSDITLNGCKVSEEGRVEIGKLKELKSFEARETNSPW